MLAADVPLYKILSDGREGGLLFSYSRRLRRSSSAFGSIPWRKEVPPVTRPCTGFLKAQGRVFSDGYSRVASGQNKGSQARFCDPYPKPWNVSVHHIVALAGWFKRLQRAV